MRGTISQRGKNSWQLKYDLPRENGIRRQRYATVTGTYKDAQRELTRLFGAVDAGTHVDPSNMTLAEVPPLMARRRGEGEPEDTGAIRRACHPAGGSALGRDETSEASPRACGAVAWPAAQDGAGTAYRRPRPSPPGARA